MMGETFYCLAFDSTHYAIKTEKKIKSNNINADMIPTPREISSSCGLSIKFLEEEKGKIISLLNSEDLERIKVYKIDKKKGENKSERMEL